MDTATTESGNGSREKIGELRGDIHALIRQLENMTAEFNAMKRSLDETRREIGEHISFHLGREKEAEEQKISTRWWTGSLMGGCGIIAGLIVKFWA